MPIRRQYYMTRNQAKIYAKGQLESYLSQKRVNTKKPFNCLNPIHPDENPSMQFDRKRDRVHCFSCGADYDIFDVIALDYNLCDPKEIFSTTYNVLGIQVDGVSGECKPFKQENVVKDTYVPQNYTADMERWRTAYPESDGAQYMVRRGIPLEVAKRFGLGYCPDWRHPDVVKKWPDVPPSPRVIIPIGPFHYIARDIRDKNALTTDVERNKVKMKVGKNAPVFNAAAIKTASKPIFVTEGEIDALSLITMGAEAIALGSAANVQKLVNLLQSEKPSQPLIIAMDNDGAAGTGAAAKIKAELEKIGIMHIIADTAALYGGEKDANDALTKLDDWQFSSNIQEVEREAEQMRDAAAAAELTAHRQTSAAYHVGKLIDIINTSANTPPTSTGFKSLDDALDGGLYEGLYILGAISSLGKTTLVMQIADQIAAAGRDVLIFSLEMARTELMAKSISRCTFTISSDKKQALTTRGITDGRRYDTYPPERRSLIETAIEHYQKVAENIYIHEGVGDIDAEKIRNITETHARITDAAPVVIIDYLQIITPHSDRASDKQAIDKAVLELKRMSRDLKIPVIAISSFNRENYTASVNMTAFKESGAVEYSADVLMGLQLEGMGELGKDSADKQSKIDELKTRDPRRVELKILKNRNGPTGGHVLFDFYARFNYFKADDNP